MTDRSVLRRAPVPSAGSDVAGGPRRIARPATRTAYPVGDGGRRGFLVLLVSGLVINVWALFPSTVESGTYVPLPQAARPIGPDGAPVADGDARRPLDPTRATAFRLMDAVSRPSAGVTGAVYTDAVAAVAKVSLRSKLQALLMLLLSRYGDDLEATAMIVKLQALLKLPDPVLERLLDHPDLVGLRTELDGVFLARPDLSGVGTELAKVDVVSTAGPTERVDLVKVNGRPTYIVHSPATATTDIPVASTFAMPQPPAEFVVETQLRTAADMFAFATPTSAEMIPPAPEPTVAPRVESFAPAPEFTATIDTEFTAPPTVSAPVTEAASTPDPTPTPTVSERPTETPSTSTDVMTTGNKFEPGETLTSPTGTNSSTTSTSSAGTTEQSTPQSTSAAGPPQVTGGETNTEPSGATQAGETGSGSTGESSP